MKNELISVIVPVYNVERYLEKCVKSLCRQTYKNLEIILVNDGSTDRSGEICGFLSKTDARIKVINKENGGLSDARNAALDFAHGSKIMFVDSDDYLSEDAAEKLLSAAEENDCEIAVCNMIRVFEDGTSEPFYCPAKETTVLCGNDRFETLCQPSVCNKLFSAELFDDVRFPKGRFYEDTFVYHILAYRAKKIVLDGNDGYFYFLRKGSILGAPKFSDRYFDYIDAVYERMAFLFENGVEDYGKGAALSLYAAVSDAEKNILKTEANKELFKKARREYTEAYVRLIRSKNVGIKQRIRLVLLRYTPMIHGKIY